MGRSMDRALKLVGMAFMPTNIKLCVTRITGITPDLARTVIANNRSNYNVSMTILHARRHLRALKGLLKLQALVRGPRCEKTSCNYSSSQVLVRAKAHVQETELLKRQEAAAQREKAMAYALAHQPSVVLLCSAVSSRVTLITLGCSQPNEGPESITFYGISYSVESSRVYKPATWLRRTE
ncbi:hypothetical protein LguiA_012540 [Lonicera macranthoides]